MTKKSKTSRSKRKRQEQGHGDPELKLEQVAEELGGELLEWLKIDEASYEEIAAKMAKKADDRMTVTNADKKANTPAYQKFKAGDKRYIADHMGEGLSVDQQMKISRDAAKDRNPNPDHKAIRGKMLRKPSLRTPELMLRR